MNLKYITITGLDNENLAIFSQYNEGQLLHYNEPDLGIFIAESPKVIFRALDAGYEPISLLVEGKTLEGKETSELMEKLRALTADNSDELPVYIGEMNLLSQITGFKLTRGVLCAMKRRVLPDVTELCKDMRRIAILENVVNPTNVGAIFRSAAALNVDAVLLTSGCSDPLYRRAARVSMGTVFQIPWTYIPSDKGNPGDWPDAGMNLLKELGFKTAAMALVDRSVNINYPPLLEEPKLAIIFGNEGDGLMEETLKSSDYVIKIPMSHGVDSLNVAASSAVIFWQLTL
ncbi:tRNA G18 (ribose-2'-O)-methylase SpoU [Oribacterium sp. KHPX15]|uniref:TrmH family RNA methyltransferase n=1 Tax=unclassified Oribacterium TaxID=2629782 RepID=UPI0005D2806C|nr:MULTISPECIES: RNA methyltransferase [unclassified Oribacterium]SEA61516.1 tRNA G18 (ribose-2'-O)-methylase SpoU [Oribacterium sp. KHPX15]